MNFSTESVEKAQVYRISPDDTNYFAILFDPYKDQTSHVFVVEVFAPNGATPVNIHHHATEFFYILAGEGVAHSGETRINLRQGSALLLYPHTPHAIHNTGLGKLYCLTVMTPNEGFAELIRKGTKISLDEEDLAILAGG